MNLTCLLSGRVRKEARHPDMHAISGLMFLSVNQWFRFIAKIEEGKAGKELVMKRDGNLLANVEKRRRKVSESTKPTLRLLSYPSNLKLF